MLDQSLSQGADLYAPPVPESTRLIAVASHGDIDGERLLLWNLCATLLDTENTSVVVLDGTSAESPNDPGLTAMLRLGHRPMVSDRSHERCLVVPSAEGLQRLCTASELPIKPLQRLGGVLQDAGLVIIYAKTDTLMALLQDSQAEFLLPVFPTNSSSITAYQALKRMLSNAGLRPTIVAVDRESKMGVGNDYHDVVGNLQDCAMYFLGHKLNVVTLPTDRRHLSSAMQRGMTRLLHGATTLQQHSSASAWRPLSGTVYNTVRSH